MDPLKRQRSNRWVPVAVIVVIVLTVAGAAWWTATATQHEPVEAATTMDAAEFAELMGRSPGSDQGCIDCHTDRQALMADLEKNPLEEVAKSTESEGEG